MPIITFKKLTLADKEELDAFVGQHASFCLYAFTFSSLVSWEMVYHYSWALVGDDTLLFDFQSLEDGKRHYLQPVGAFPTAVQRLLIEEAAVLEYPLEFFAVSEGFLRHYPDFATHFKQVEHRDLDNYIYSSKDLALLAGSRYQPKRNLLHQFEAQHRWTSEPVSPANVADCREVLREIYPQFASAHEHYPETVSAADAYLAHELQVLDFVLANFAALEQHGLLVRINDVPVAFSLFEKLNPTTCVVHFEKALRQYKGLYQLVNRETAKYALSKGYQHINREEDLGLEGLRKAKLSYYPESMCPAYGMVFQSAGGVAEGYQADQEGASTK